MLKHSNGKERGRPPLRFEMLPSERKHGNQGIAQKGSAGYLILVP